MNTTDEDSFSNNSSKIICLKLTESLREAEIVSRFEYDLKTEHLVLELNHKYHKKIIISPLESDWSRTVQTLEKQLKRKGVNQEHITMLADVVDNNAEAILSRRVNAEEEEKTNGKAKKKKKHYIQKYRGKDFLAEAVIVEGKPYFAIIKDDGSITLEDSVQEYGENFLPPTQRRHLNKPYVFKSKEEFDEMVEKAKTETVDSLYDEVKSQWQKYSAADNNEIALCSADTIYSYEQDILGMTHYLFFVGSPESGKSNRLLVFFFLAYRCIMSADMTISNIYRFLGSVQEGQGTICEDEADDLDESPDKMRIYKVGYTTGSRVYRNDEDASQGRTQDAYYTFCFKSLAAEKPPDSVKAKGFRERIVEIKCQSGTPRYDISEVANPAQEEEFEEQLKELDRLRNRLLLFRLLHYREKIPNMRLNISNREKQLFKPVLRVFQNTKTLKELLLVITYFVRERRQQNVNNLHSFLYRVIKQLTSKNVYQLETGLIWGTVKDSLPGSEIAHRQLSYESSEFGTISQRQITEILMTHFSAKRPKHTGKKKELVFDREIMERLDRKYNINLEITVCTESDESDESDVGLNGYISQDLLDKEIERPDGDSMEKDVASNESGASTEHINTSQNTNKTAQPTQATQTTRSTIDKETVFESRLTEIADKNGGVFKGSDLQDRLVGSTAWTDMVFLVKKALEKGKIEIVEGQFDTYRVMK